MEISIEDPTSSHPQRPDIRYLSSTQEDRERYLTQCVPLHKAALKGDWKEAKKILEQDATLLLTAAITKGWATLLHVVAVGANHAHFVEELVNLMRPDDLELQDNMGNTAFCFAAATGNVQIAEIMIKRNESLPRIRGGQGATPLHFAVLRRRSEMAEYLFPKSQEVLEERDWNFLFLSCINSGLYGLALKMLDLQPSVATARGDNEETGLHLLARKPSLCSCQSLRSRKHLLHLCYKDTSILKLTKRMWQIFLLDFDEKMMLEIIRQPSHVIFLAAEAGNFEFLSLLMSTDPDLIWELDNIGRNIIHTAVLHRD